MTTTKTEQPDPATAAIADPVKAIKAINRELSCITAQLGKMMAPLSALNGENLANTPVAKIMEAGNSLQIELQRVEALSGNLRAILTGAIMGLKNAKGSNTLEGLLAALQGAAAEHDCGDPDCRAHGALRGGRDTVSDKDN